MMAAQPQRFEDPEKSTTNGGQVYTLPTREREPVPYETMEILAKRLQKEMDEHQTTREQATRLRGDVRRLQREKDDLLEESADRETVMTLMQFWHKKAQRTGRTRLTMSGDRARCTRWMLSRKYPPCDICYAIEAFTDQEDEDARWRRKKGYDDITYLCRNRQGYSETKLEMMIEKGKQRRRRLGLPVVDDE